VASPIYSYQQVASTTSKLEQIVMLYDGAIKFLLLSIDDIKHKDMVAKGEHVDRSLAIIDYLRGILDMNNGGEVAGHLDRLYEILIHQIIMANATMDCDLFESSVASLREIRSAWQQIAVTPQPSFAGQMPAKAGMFQTELRSVRMTG
jgi:flagellar protein FliS